jgi:hypothetical protein
MQGLGKLFLWCAAGVGLYVVSEHFEGTSKYSLAFAVVTILLLYQFQSIKGKLDSITMRLDSLRDRLSPKPRVDYRDEWRPDSNERKPAQEKKQSQERKRFIYPGEVPAFLGLLAVLAVYAYLTNPTATTTAIANVRQIVGQYLGAR